MEFTTLEVDGSLVNPFVAGAVAIWAAVLSSLAVLAARRQGRRTLRIVALAFAVLLTTATSVAQSVIGVILYSVTSARFVDVGFWGGPPLWPAPVVAVRWADHTVLPTQCWSIGRLTAAAAGERH